MLFFLLYINHLDYLRKFSKVYIYQERLTTTEMIEQHIYYIHENPVRTGLVASAKEYLYSSARNYAGLSSILEIDRL